ncbi:MAG: DUF4013 domain-containing protein [Methanobacterium sp.]|jgi:hypothetical protein
MEIGEIINDALRYPTSNWTKVFILGVIFVASFLIIPIFLAFGYLFRIIKATFAGIDELPDFDDLGEMFVDGLKVFVVGVAYAIPLIIISAIISAIFGIHYNSAVNAGTFTGFNVFAYATAYVIYAIIGIIIGLIEYMAIANMALYEGDLAAAFKFNEVLDRIARVGWGKYIIWYIVMVVLGLIAALISGLLIVILIGIIIAPLIIAPFFGMFAARSLALIFASSEETPAASTEPVEPVETVVPEEPVESGESVEPAETEEPVEPEEPKE